MRPSDLNDKNFAFSTIGKFYLKVYVLCYFNPLWVSFVFTDTFKNHLNII